MHQQLHPSCSFPFAGLLLTFTMAAKLYMSILMLIYQWLQATQQLHTHNIIVNYLICSRVYILCMSCVCLCGHRSFTLFIIMHAMICPHMLIYVYTQLSLHFIIYILTFYFRLLDILADRKAKKGLSGHVLVNGRKQPHNFKCESAYVVQVGCSNQMCNETCMVLHCAP